MTLWPTQAGLPELSLQPMHAAHQPIAVFFEMSFHPSLMVFLSVGIGAMAIAVLMAIVVERIDSALTPPQRTAGANSLVKPDSTAQAKSR